MSSSIVFDQYQRYHFIEQVILNLSSRADQPILEVGALGSPLPGLLPDYRVVTLDTDPRSSAIDLRGSGLHLPFKDRTFPIVVCTDVLEHMDVTSRDPFLKELTRITSKHLILGFPHFDPLNTEADRLFYEFIKNYSGLDFEYLQEHLKYGLPDAREIQSLVRTLFPEVQEFQNANISSWTLLQLGNFILMQNPELESVRTLWNDFFNQSLEFFSHRSPNYRTFLVASRYPLPTDLKAQLEKREDATQNDFVGEFAAKSFALISASQAAIGKKNAEIKSIQTMLESMKAQEDRQIAEIGRLQETVREYDVANETLQNSLRGYAQANQNLQDYLNLFLQHPAYKIFRFLKKSLQSLFKNRIRPAGDIGYLIFQKNCEPDEKVWKKQIGEWQKWPLKPALNIVTAVFNPDADIFQQTIQSVLNQTYGNWIWNIADASTDDAIWKFIEDLAAREARVKPLRLRENGGISTNINAAMMEATGDYVVFLDHDDTLAPHALFAVGQAIMRNPNLDFIYSDADKLDESGQRCEPLFKPDWSPDMMLCCNLLNQISVFRRSLLEEVGYLNPEMDGAQDWDLYLRMMEKTDRFHHIPQILYHWRKTPQSCAQRPENKPYARKAQLLAVQNHLVRSGRIDPTAAFDETNRVNAVHPMSTWKNSEDYPVSIIIPTSDHASILSKCLQGLCSLTTYKNLQIVVVDTGSKEETTFDLYKKYAEDPRFLLVNNTPPFNFAKACNLGASHSTGSLLLFLNNDVEIIQEDWLERMIQWFEISEIGAVGPKLLYPNGKIQHAGIVVGLGGLAAHVFMGAAEHATTIFGSDDWYRDVTAVTGACLLIRREVFERAGKFDENYQVNFSDVDLCLRIRQLGYRIVYTPQARLVHHESATHRGRLPRVDFEYANRNFGKWLVEGDPYFNSNISYRDPIPLFRNNPADSCEDTNQVLMNHLPKSETVSLPLRLPQEK